MNIKHIESVVRLKVCPVCLIGMTKEIGRKVYQCSRAQCGETFNFSLLSDAMIRDLLAKEQKKETNPKEARQGT